MTRAKTLHAAAMRKRRKRLLVPPNLLSLRDRFVTLCGTIGSVTVEAGSDPEKIDHLWISVSAGEDGTLDIALNTRSRKSALAGYDPRVRLGIAVSTWKELPAAGVRIAEPLDYTSIEATQPITYTLYDRSALEQLLMQKARDACFAQAWGELYVRAHIGVHQIHSRRASFAHGVDHLKKDGALGLYFAADRRFEMLLFKFAGQP